MLIYFKITENYRKKKNTKNVQLRSRIKSLVACWFHRLSVTLCRVCLCMLTWRRLVSPLSFLYRYVWFIGGASDSRHHPQDENITAVSCFSVRRNSVEFVTSIWHITNKFYLYCILDNLPNILVANWLITTLYVYVIICRYIYVYNIY